MARNTAEPIVIEGNTGTALADFAEIERQALAQMQQRIQAPSGNGISIRDKQFKFPDGRVADSLNVVVLDFVTRNLYYVGRFDPKNPAPPTCFAIGKDLKTLKPSVNSADVQNEAGCATCENNVFGSNGAGKACKNTRLLAVLEVGEDYATAPIYTISVPPKSLKAFDGYINTIGSLLKRAHWGVQTRISFHPEAEHEQLVFGHSGANESIGECLSRLPEAEMLLTVEPDTSRLEAKPAAPARGGRR